MTSLSEILVGLPLLASVLLKITIVLGVSWSLHFILAKRNPRWRILLWRCAITGLLLIPALIPLAYLQISITPPPEHVVIAPSESALEYPIIETPGFSETEPVQISQPVASDISQASFSLTAWLRANIWMIVSMGWGSVATMLILRLLVGFLQIRQKIVSSLRGPEHLQQLLGRVTEDLGCTKKVMLRYSPDMSTPFLTGLLNPIIIIPERMISGKYENRIPAIFAHEVAHLISRDLIWTFIIRWFEVVLWFHPLVWKLRGVHSALCEEVSDAVAAKYIGNTESYSSTLASLALEIIGRVQVVGAIPMARSSEIVARLRILKQRFYPARLARRWIILSGLVSFIALAVIGGINLVYAESDPGKSATRVLHFPKDRSLGVVYVRDKGMPGEEGFEKLGEAQDEVVVGKGKEVRLNVTEDTLKNLSYLSTIGPDELENLLISSQKIKDTDLKCIKNLTGLQRLTLLGPITGEGLIHLQGMQCLKELHLLRTQVNDQGLEHLKRIGSLEKLFSWGNSGITGVGFGQLRSLESLKTVSFYQTPISNAGMKYISEIKTLEDLSLQYTEVTEEGLEYLKRLPKLKSLILPPRTTDKDLAKLKEMKTLEKLRISHSKITDGGLVHLKNMESLKSLGISSMLMTGEGLPHLKEMPSLQDLSVSLQMINDAGLSNLEGLPVTSLNLSRTVVSDVGFVHIAKLKSLEQLFMDNTAVTDAGMVHLASLTSLKYLNLNNTQIGDTGLSYLRNLLKLETLNLRRTKITDVGLNFLRGLNSLRQVDVKGTQVTPGGAEVIRQALPKCTVEGVGEAVQEIIPKDISREKGLIGKSAPKLGIEKLLQVPEGTVASWEKLKGKVVVLEFWGTWCGPCVKAFPHINSLADKFKNKPVQFICITDESESVVTGFLGRYLLKTWVALDTDRSIFESYQIEGRPRTVVVNPEGRIVSVGFPMDLTEQTLNRLLSMQD